MTSISATFASPSQPLGASRSAPLPPSVDGNGVGAGVSEGTDDVGRRVQTATLAEGDGVIVRRQVTEGPTVEIPDMGPVRLPPDDVVIIETTVDASDVVSVSDGPDGTVDVTVNGQSTRVTLAPGQRLVIRTGAGDDQADVLVSGERRVEVDAGSGNDRITARHEGTLSNHTFIPAVSIDGGDGDDTIRVSSDAKFLYTKDSGTAFDTDVGVSGGEGNDTIDARGHGAQINGDGGDDRIRVHGSLNTVNGGGGGDVIELWATPLEERAAADCPATPVPQTPAEPAPRPVPAEPQTPDGGGDTPPPDIEILALSEPGSPNAPAEPPSCDPEVIVPGTNNVDPGDGNDVVVAHEGTARVKPSSGNLFSGDGDILVADPAGKNAQIILWR